MTTREEAAKMRKELMTAERILAQKEKIVTKNKDLTPMSLGNNKVRPEPQSNSDMPNYIHIPKKRKQNHENKPYY
ncbi:MAG: hypothetical protein GOVbin556_70 [Prokaryotic dsDNA virus sp.]|mgnify:FL=1|nr:MAG: hypothetical protein GOVbin556_70 [Prokaryotic dsDNA virus sp.]|tara:strand:- start:857 stop:1081 length:225 start_codon:yes stop_codon:yes gene_type:complete